jgi:hypothetical protein
MNTKLEHAYMKRKDLGSPAFILWRNWGVNGLNKKKQLKK